MTGTAMKDKKDITDIGDIRLLVDTFYTAVRQDTLIGPIFISVIQDRWPQHLDKMYKFWETVLLDNHTYYGAPFPPHARLPIDQAHFDAWLKLWRATIDALFDGAKAGEAKWRGEKMAAMFLSRIAAYRGGTSLPLM